MTCARGIIILQPVPWKVRLEMIVEMQIEILNGGEILVNCKPNIRFELVPGDPEKFKFNQNLNLNLYREIQRNFSFSISTS